MERPGWFPTGLGAVIAFLVIVAAFVLALMGKMEMPYAVMFIALGLARLC